MPLYSGKSKEAFSANVAIEMKHGKSRKQAIAIAASVASERGHHRDRRPYPYHAKHKK
ncbi:hypothetical protein [Ralstonia phage vB_RsoP_BMB50]|uniref:Uncharacterized protein n=1 Tax=Ralstonia phage vB_RsoP_BMB50 TaxID=2834269 RepID=A0A8E5KHE6_9CAUD|nr:hypothetical protein [Ralstonia phage vB_RsoP_BMB50]